MVFWDLANTRPRFPLSVPFFLCGLFFYSEDESSMFPRNADTYLQNDCVLLPDDYNLNTFVSTSMSQTVPSANMVDHHILILTRYLSCIDI